MKICELCSTKFFIRLSLIGWMWQIARLQENNKALERLTKSKEAALVEAGRTVEVAEAKAATIDDLQNQNQELLRKIEIYQVHTSICLQTS